MQNASSGGGELGSQEQLSELLEIIRSKADRQDTLTLMQHKTNKEDSERLLKAVGILH
jgi:hypothetical protein